MCHAVGFFSNSFATTVAFEQKVIEINYFDDNL